MKKYKMNDPMPTGVAVFLIVAGLILGSVFVFGMQYWNADIEREDAVLVSAEFESYRFDRSGRGGNISEIRINLKGHPSFSIDGVCASTDVILEVKKLPKGAVLNMLVHPNSDTIWELKQGAKTILSFEEAREKLEKETIGFAFLGGFMYFCAAYGFGSLFQRWHRAGRKEKHNR